MASNNNEGADNNPDNSKDSGLEKSFVGKFMSGIINSTPLTKWFWKDSSPRSAVRRREEDEEFDASYNFQPPSKRAKLPSELERNNYSAHVFESPVTVHTSNNVNNVSSSVFGNFPEPVPGPSGIRSRKLFEKHNSSSTNTISADSFDAQLDEVNGEHDSDSGESTSGYSSAPKLLGRQKNEENANNKETSQKVTPKTRSLFTPTNNSSGTRTLFSERSPQMNTSLSSRRPAFNASTFGSPNFVDRTLSTKKILDSPFYSGRTIYGGASAYGRKLGKGSEELPIRTSVQIKPANDKKEKSKSDNTTLSKTARRILNTLEQYSTPISDAKKIPVTPRRPGLLSSYIGATPYLVSERKRPLTKELQVPTIPDLLQMKQKERLQNSTETVRQIATRSQSTLNKEEYKLRTEDDNKQKHSNKMKRNVTSTRQKVQPIELVSEVKLPKVSLPITTLPKFDFVLMPPSKASTETNQILTKPSSSLVNKPTVVQKKETENKVVGKTNANTNVFTFSEPLVIAKDLKSIAAINCFKFSEPLSKKSSDVWMMFKSSSNDSGFKSGNLKMKNNGENLIFTAKPAPKLATGSVMDILGKKTQSQSNKIAAKSWECPTCWVKNDADKTQCCACDEPKPQSEVKGFGDQFKLSSDKWECGSCMVRNNNSDTKCVACATPKTNDNKAIVSSGFGDKFKPPASTWECTSCLIRNKTELDTCAACGTAKTPTSNNFGDKFKPSSDTWECDVCMIRNKSNVDKCVACETPKPGKTVSAPKPVSFSNSTGTTFSFGIKQEWECQTCMIKNKNDLKKCAACEMPRDGSTTQIGFGDAFKTKSGEWECTSCMVKNKSTTNECVCCGVPKPGKFNEKLAEISKEEKKPVNSFNFGIDKAATQFKFGIPSTTEIKDSNAVVSTAPTFSFGVAAKTTAATSSTFSFGIKPSEKSESNKSVEPTKSVATSVSTPPPPPPSITSNPLLKPSEKLPDKATPAPVGFKFGLDNSSKSQVKETVSKVETTSATTFSTNFGAKPMPAFQFKPAAVNGDVNKPKDAEIADKSNIFSTDLNKPKEAMFSDANKSKESPFGKPVKSTEAPFGGATKLPDSPFGTASKPADSPFSKSVALPFSSANKPADSPFGNKDASFATSNKPVETPFGSMSKTANSPFASTSKIESPFGKPNKPAESPFGTVPKPTESPFGTMNKPANSPFAKPVDPSKPKENLFGTPNNGSKPPSGLFGNANEASKPGESLFSNTSTKPKEVLFGSKPPENSNLFGAPTSTPAFTFAPKAAESTSSNFAAAPSTSQPSSSGMFKFGPDPPQNSNKRPTGETSDNTVSNGFGSGAKIPAFGAPQGFGSTDKPFSFGSSEATPKPSGFPFAQAEKPSTSGPVFNFGSGTASSTPSGGFNFSVPSTGFNFGGPAKVESPPFNPPSNNVFGSTGTGAKNGSFNFGPNANNNAEKAVFSFGGNQTSQPNQPNFPTQGQSGFNFGASAPLNPQMGAFNFSGTPPSFNFTDGNSSQTQPHRKIKKALRRTHR